jgi:hypothetical protein
MPITVTVTPAVALINPDAALVVDGSLWIGTWNFDPVRGPNLATGPIFVNAGATRPGIEVIFLDEARAALAAPAPYRVEWEVAAPGLATFAPRAGEPARFDLIGTSAGSTTATARLFRDDALAYESGPIPLVVGGTPTGDATPSFYLRKNGVTTVLVLDGALADSGCDRTANPGRLESAVGDTTDLYSIRTLDALCVRGELSESQYQFAFEFDDDGIAGIVNHPRHWGEILEFHLFGEAVGQTTLHLHVIRNGLIEFSSPPIPVAVTG